MVRLLAIPNDPTSDYFRSDEEDFLSENNPRTSDGQRFFDSVAFLNWRDDADSTYCGVESHACLKNKAGALSLMGRLIRGEIPFSSPLFEPIFSHEKDRIVGIARDYKPDVVRAFNTHFAAELGCMVSRELDVPLVVSAHDPSRLTSAVGYADSLVCESNELIETCKTRFGVDAEKMTVIHNPINMDVFRSQALYDIGRNVPKEWADAPYRVLSISRLVYGKNIEGLLEALSMVKDEFPGMVHYHFGNGSKEKVEDVEALRKSLGLMDTSFFMGGVRKSQLPAYYSSAHVFVLPTYWEGLSRSVREALACGTPAITTNYGSTAEIVLNGYNGIGINPKSSDDIARGLREFFGNASLRECLTRNARPSVLTKYDAVSSMRMHCENYEQVLSKGRKKNERK